MSDNKFRAGQKSPWSWILGFVILAGFVWFMLTYVYMPNGNLGKVLPGDSTYSQVKYQPPADTANEVKDFVAYVKDTTLDLSAKKYTEEGLIKLQSALSYIADRDSANYLDDEKIDSLDRTIVKIDTSSSNYLKQVKPAFSAAVRAIESIQNSDTTTKGSTAELRQIELNIDTSKSLESQLIKIKEFFTEAGSALQNEKLSYAYSLNKKSY